MGSAQQAYTSRFLYVRVVSGHPENLERNHLIVVPTPPNFGWLRDPLRAISLLHDALKVI